MRGLVPLLYWFGLLVTLVGVGLRFWSVQGRLGLAVALVGIGMMIVARVGMWRSSGKSKKSL